MSVSLRRRFIVMAHALGGVLVVALICGPPLVSMALDDFPAQVVSGILAILVGAYFSVDFFGRSEMADIGRLLVLCVLVWLCGLVVASLVNVVALGSIVEPDGWLELFFVPLGMFLVWGWLWAALYVVLASISIRYFIGKYAAA